MVTQYKGAAFGELSPQSCPFVFADAAYSLHRYNANCFYAALWSFFLPMYLCQVVVILELGGVSIGEGYGYDHDMTIERRPSAFMLWDRVGTTMSGMFYYDIDDSKEYFATRGPMDVVGISTEERCDIKSLEDSLFKRIIVTHDETITKWLDPEAAVASRDALANCVVVNTFCIYPEDGEAPPSGVDDRTKLAYFHKPGVLHNLNSRYDVNEIYSYDQLRNQLVNMLSGESEVGETESTKLLMQYLAYLGGRAASEGRIVAQQVLEVCLAFQPVQQA
ncbi:unnamed protein product [Ilex paraguariensis]|uniref:Uncharacterized protein n=1 Tax=Ilex paraguariensis TaxID=185542 RepID=A0ABC8UQY0_9AQUA